MYPFKINLFKQSTNKKKTDVYPGVDGELQVLGARDNGGCLEAGVGVGDHVHDGRI